jgi:hypothetical protein
MEALLDVYCRFGNFAGVTILQRKNYGYLYFTTPESAFKAIEVRRYSYKGSEGTIVYTYLSIYVFFR